VILYVLCLLWLFYWSMCCLRQLNITVDVCLWWLDTRSMRRARRTHWKMHCSVPMAQQPAIRYSVNQSQRGSRALDLPVVSRRRPRRCVVSTADISWLDPRHCCIITCLDTSRCMSFSLTKTCIDRSPQQFNYLVRRWWGTE